MYITAFIPPITVYIPVNNTTPIAPYQNGIPSNSETTIPPAYIVTETFVKTYAIRENRDKNHLDLESNLFSKNSGIVKAPLLI